MCLAPACTLPAIQLRFWKDIRSTADIRKYMNDFTVGHDPSNKPSDLVALWDFKDTDFSDGGKVLDITKNGYDGTCTLSCRPARRHGRALPGPPVVSVEGPLCSEEVGLSAGCPSDTLVLAMCLASACTCVLSC